MPIARIRSISTELDHPHCSIHTARIIQSIATREPTEMSIPPVSMTQVIPAVMQIRPALLIRMLRNVWKDTFLRKKYIVGDSDRWKRQLLQVRQAG